MTEASPNRGQRKSKADAGADPVPAVGCAPDVLRAVAPKAPARAPGGFARPALAALDSHGVRLRPARVGISGLHAHFPDGKQPRHLAALEEKAREPERAIG